MSERAVSNVLGYSLMFSIIIVATITVSVIAFGQLETVRNAEQLSNAERGLFVLDQNIDEIQTSRAAVRSGEIDLHNGKIGLTGAADSAISVRVDSPQDNYDERIPVGALVYRLDDSEIAIEGGGVFRSDGGNAVVQQEPSFLCTGDTAIVSVVTLRGDTSRALGSGTISVRIEKNVSQIRFPRNRTGRNSVEGSSSVTVDVSQTKYTQGWVQSLDADSNWKQTAPETYACENVDTYYVRRTVVDIGFTR